MNKLILVTLLVISIGTISCRKEKIETVVIDNTIKHTDDPPAALFNSYTTYGTITNFWIDSAVLRNAVVQSGSQYWLDPYGNITYDRYGDWRRISAYVYWGRLDNVDYLSTGKMVVWMSPDATLQAVELVNRKHVAIGSYCSQCTITLGNSNSTGIVDWVQ